MSEASAIRVNGRTYITIREAARLTSYSLTYLYACCRRGKLAAIAGPKGRLYVNRADVLRFAEKQTGQQSKWQQIGAWWRAHPGERAAIQGGHQFQRTLAQAGIRCSLARAQAWLARYAPRPRLVDAVIAWLQSDPARRRLSIAQARRDLYDQTRLVVHSVTIYRAWKQFDMARDVADPPFDPARYQSANDAAAQWNVSRDQIRRAVRRGKLHGITWKRTLYVPRHEVRQHFGARRLKKGQADAAIRAWYQAHPAYLDRTLADAQRAYQAETGIRLSQNLFSRARRVVRGQEPHL